MTDIENMPIEDWLQAMHDEAKRKSEYWMKRAKGNRPYVPDSPEYHRARNYAIIADRCAWLIRLVNVENIAIRCGR